LHSPRLAWLHKHLSACAYIIFLRKHARHAQTSLRLAWRERLIEHAYRALAHSTPWTVIGLATGIGCAQAFSSGACAAAQRSPVGG